MTNPYLTEYLSLPDDSPMWQGELVGKKTYSVCPNTGVYLDHRRKLVTKYSWAVPSHEVICNLAQRNKRIIEIGAGTGYWGWMLSQCNVNYVGYDIHPPSIRNLNKYAHEVIWMPIRKGNHKAIDQHNTNRTLMLCWPPYSENMAFNCLIQYRGNRLIYIGEGEYGCTANDKFFEELDRNWKLEQEHDIPQWSGIHDSVYEYVRI